MLRINLLPSYVALRRTNRVLYVVFTLAFFLICGGLVAWNYTILQPIPDLQAKTARANDIKKKSDDLNSQASDATDSIAPIQAKLQFVQDVADYNLAYVKLFEHTAKYTSPKILYKSMTVNGTTMTMDAYTPSFADLGRYLQVMYTDPDVTTVAISDIPGYGAPNPEPLDVETLPAGSVGHLPGLAEPITSYTVYRGKIVGINGRSNVAGPAPRPFDLKKDGFPVTITLTLKNPLSPPSVPADTASGGDSTDSGDNSDSSSN